MSTSPLLSSLLCLLSLRQGVLGVEIPSHVQLPVLPAVLDHVLRHGVKFVRPVALSSMGGGDASRTETTHGTDGVLRNHDDKLHRSCLHGGVLLILSGRGAKREQAQQCKGRGGGGGRTQYSEGGACDFSPSRDHYHIPRGGGSTVPTPDNEAPPTRGGS